MSYISRIDETGPLMYQFAMYCKIHQLHGTDIPLLDAARERSGVDGIEVSVYREVVVEAMKKTM